MYRTVTVQIELVLEDAFDYHDDNGKLVKVYAGKATKDDIAAYLNEKLANDPEWFGDFGPENIIKTDLFEV